MRLFFPCGLFKVSLNILSKRGTTHSLVLLLGEIHGLSFETSFFCCHCLNGFSRVKEMETVMGKRRERLVTFTTLDDDESTIIF